MKSNKSSNSNSSPNDVQPVSAGKNPKNILVPIDFSPESVAALRAAVSAAKKSDVSLTLLNIVEGGTFYRGLNSPGSYRKLQESHARQMEHLAETELPPSMTADLIVGDGDPAREINRIAKERHMDYILVGEHENHRVWLGDGTANKVAGSAPCKVIVLKSDQPEVAFTA